MKDAIQISKDAMPKVMPIEIICGNCAGDELLPIPTTLTASGLCAECGGNNYVLASKLEISSQATLTTQGENQ